MKVIVILIAKLLAALGGLLGKGSSFPGALALKLYPTVLTRLTLSGHIIAVTGSNGKSTTAAMISHAFEKNGKKVLCNRQGSNQIQGVATLLLKNADIKGRVKADAVVIECDERYTDIIFKNIKPEYFLVTNICRDQMTRNGHPFWIYNILCAAAENIPDATFILNADDPIVRRLGLKRERVRWFGINSTELSVSESDALYNDCCYCPQCKKKLSYDRFYYSHLGSYRCGSCGYSRPSANFSVNSAKPGGDSIEINSNRVELNFTGIYNIYNLCAAFAACSLAGESAKSLKSALSGFVINNGRMESFFAGGKEGTLMISKHENSTSYNTNFEYIVSLGHSAELIIFVDSVSRKYYTAETSWLWDISFEILAAENIERVYLSGKYAYDLAVRTAELNVDEKKFVVQPDIAKLASELCSNGVGHDIYALTCFSDKDKLLSAFKREKKRCKG